MLYLYCAYCDWSFSTDNEDDLIQCPECGDAPREISKSEYDQECEASATYSDDTPEYLCDLSGNVILCNCEDYPCCGH